MNISLAWILIITGIIAVAYSAFSIPYGIHLLGKSTSKPQFQGDVVKKMGYEEDINTLQALRDEIANNYSLYFKLKTDEQLYRSGESVHYTDYETISYDHAIKSGVFQFNTDLLNRVRTLYTFLKMANNIFAEMRKPGLSKEHRSVHYSGLFDNHIQNEDAWEKIINDLGQYINEYEEIGKLVEKRALENGTELGVALSSEGNKLLIMNYGGENAKKISLNIDYDPPNIPPFKSDYPTHVKGMTAQFDLSEPKNKSKNYRGVVSISFQSEHSKGIKSIESVIEWNIEKKKWVLMSDVSGTVEEGIVSFPVGNIFESEKDADKSVNTSESEASLFLNLEENEQVWKIINNGESAADKYVIELPFGKEGVEWDDVYLSDLVPGKEISINLPKPIDDSKPVGVGAQITFRTKGKEKIMYRITTIKWDPVSKKWMKGF